MQIAEAREVRKLDSVFPPKLRYPSREFLVRPYVLAGLIFFLGQASHYLAYLVRGSAQLILEKPFSLPPETSLLVLIPLFGIAQLVAFGSLGLFLDPRDRTRKRLVGRCFGGALIAEFILQSAAFAVEKGFYPRSVSALSFLFNAVGTGTLLVVIKHASLTPLRVLLVGDDDQIQEVFPKLQVSPRLAGSEFFTTSILAPNKETDRLIRKAEIDQIILIAQERIEERLLPALSHPVKLCVVPTIYDVVTSGRVDGYVVQDTRMLEIDCPLDRWDYGVLKRLTDVFLAGLIFVLFLPLMAAISIAILATMGQPVFYSQIRVGRRGRLFRIYKFRTMVQDAERHTGPVLALPGDVRITPLGRLLRSCRLDELPQLWNVLCGSMSLIGPRPERPEFVAAIEKEIPCYGLRHRIRPGMSGLAQVYETYHADAREKLRFDLAYVYNWSPFLDIYLLASTVITMMTRWPTQK